MRPMIVALLLSSVPAAAQTTITAPTIAQFSQSDADMAVATAFHLEFYQCVAPPVNGSCTPVSAPFQTGVDIPRAQVTTLDPPNCASLPCLNRTFSLTAAPADGYLASAPAGVAFVARMMTKTATLSSPMSDPSNTFIVRAGPPPTDACASAPLTVVVTSYTTPLAPGQEGTVVVQAPGPATVTRMQVLLGTQVIGEITGAELRFVRAIGFGTPRTAGTYHLFVTADDSRGCHAATTADRPLVIQ